MSMADSAETFTILTIGDGLMGQIPALLMSTATGIMVTRASKDEENFAEGVIRQLGNDYKVLMIVGGIMLLFAAVPGLPGLSLGFVGFIFFAISLTMKYNEDGELIKVFKQLFGSVFKKTQSNYQTKAKENLNPNSKNQPKSKPRPKKQQKTAEELAAEEELELEEALRTEILQLDLGYQLIKLVDKYRGGELLTRLKQIRRSIAKDFGFIMPQLRVKDNLRLKPNQYEIKLKGVPIGHGELYVDKFLAMESDLVVRDIEGIHVKEPAFGFSAVWIDRELKDEATINGYTVADPTSIVITHIAELVKKHASELITRQDIKKLIDGVKKDYPVVVEEALKHSSNGQILSIIKELLSEKIPVRDMLTILETVADIAPYIKNVDLIVEKVRQELSNVITSLYKDKDNKIHTFVFDTKTEDFLISQCKEINGKITLSLSTKDTNSLINQTKELKATTGKSIILTEHAFLRRTLVELYRNFDIKITVLNAREIYKDTKYEFYGQITLD